MDGMLRAHGHRLHTLVARRSGTHTSPVDGQGRNNTGGSPHTVVHLGAAPRSFVLACEIRVDSLTRRDDGDGASSGRGFTKPHPQPNCSTSRGEDEDRADDDAAHGPTIGIRWNDSWNHGTGESNGSSRAADEGRSSGLFVDEWLRDDGAATSGGGVNGNGAAGGDRTSSSRRAIQPTAVAPRRTYCGHLCGAGGYPHGSLRRRLGASAEVHR
jgi:hypothetical protein